jgi:DNA-binding GntR family transcriptional regulator
LTTRTDGSRFRTKREFAIDGLVAAILRGKYPPGTRLRQDPIARELGLSATPVREALAELQAQGLLVYESHRGARVAELKLADLEELYPLRALLESYATRLTAAKLGPEDLRRLDHLQTRMELAVRRWNLAALRDADREFHMTIYSVAGNSRLIALIRQLWAAFPRYMLWLIPDRAEESVTEHRRILEALHSRAGEIAGVEMTKHLESALGAFRRSIGGTEGVASGSSGGKFGRARPKPRGRPRQRNAAEGRDPPNVRGRMGTKGPEEA